MDEANLPGGAWLINAGAGDEWVETFEQKRAVALSSPDIGDAAGLQTLEDIKSRLILLGLAGSTEKLESRARNLFYFLRVISQGDCVLTDHKQMGDVLVGRIASEVEYDPSLFDVEHVYVRRVEWLTRIKRTQFTDFAQRDLYSIVGVSDVGSHFKEIRQRVTGIEIGDNSDFRTMSRGQTLVGEAVTIDRTDPLRLVVTRHRGYYAWSLAGDLAGYAILTAIFGGFSMLVFTMSAQFSAGFARVVLLATVVGLGVVALRGLPRAWESLTIGLLEINLILDRASQTISMSRARMARLDNIAGVEIHTRYKVYYSGGSIFPSRTTLAPSRPQVERHEAHSQIALRFKNGRQIAVCRSSDDKETRIIAYALADFLNTQLVRTEE